MTTYAVRLDRLQAGLIAWIRGAHPSAVVTWGQSGFPAAGTEPLAIQVRMIGGPSSAALGGESSTPALLPTSATIRVLSAPVGSSVLLRASGLRWDYELQPGDTVEDVRDGLLTAIGPSPLMSVASVASGTTDLILTPTSLGDLYGVQVAQSEAGIVEVNAMPTTPVYVQSGDVRTMVEIQAWASSRYAAGSAHNALATLTGARKLPAAQAILAAYGLGISGGVPAPVDLTSMSGPAWQSRAALTLYVSQVSMMAEPRTTVDRIRGTLVARAPDADVSIDTQDPP